MNTANDYTANFDQLKAETMTKNTFEPKGASTMTTDTDTHGRDQAAAQAASVADMVAALNCDFDRLQELRDEKAERISAILDAETPNEVEDQNQRMNEWKAENAEELQALEIEAGDCADQDDARARIQEDALSVEVRSDWDIVGGDTTAAEFRIVLCTGGPHVEIMGELDQYQQPCRAWIQYQDWGTPMAHFFSIEQSTLLEYCSQFYFGE